MNNKKITIIGAGPGGYEAAIMASKLGADVTVIEKEHLGGTCLNHGCIPTKVFLASAEVYTSAKHANAFGISTGELHRFHEQVLNRKNKSVRQLVNGIEQLFKSNNIRLIYGTGSIKDPHTVVAETEDGIVEVDSDYIIIATGSIPVIPDVLKYDGKRVISSNELLELDNLPNSIIIIGGNIVAAEVGQYLARFGAHVVMIEALDRIIPFEDPEVSKQLLRQFKKDKIKVLTNTRVAKTELTENGVEVLTEDGKIYDADKILVCIGRMPLTGGLNLESLGIVTDDKGFIKVDDTMKTSVDNIYAIGDVIKSPMLAHVASHEGIVAAHNIVNNSDKKVNYKAVPRCIYTDPEIAAVGVTEQQLINQGKDYKIGTFNYKSLGKALAINKPLGFAKVITDNEGKIIGASLVGNKASEQLSELTLAIDLGLTATYLGDLIHPHPTLSEAIMEACRDVNNESINKL